MEAVPACEAETLKLLAEVFQLVWRNLNAMRNKKVAPRVIRSYRDDIKLTIGLDHLAACASDNSNGIELRVNRLWPRRCRGLVIFTGLGLRFHLL